MWSNASNVCGMHTSVATVIVGTCWTQAGHVGSWIQVDWRFQYLQTALKRQELSHVHLAHHENEFVMIVTSMAGRNSSDADLLGALLFLGGRQEQVCQVILVQLQHVAAHSKSVLARVPVQDVEQLCDASRCQTCRHSSSCRFTGEGTYTALRSSDRQRPCRSCRTHALWMMG